MISRGAIVLVNFPYSDLSTSKIRPALVVSNELSIYHEVIALFITSKMPTEIVLSDVVIHSSIKDFEQTGLRKSSLIRCAKIVTLDSKLIEGVLGYLPVDELRQVEIGLMSAFGISRKVS